MGDARQVPESHVTYVNALDVPVVFFLPGVSCLSAPKEVGLLVWDIGKDIFKEENFAHGLVILSMPG